MTDIGVSKKATDPALAGPSLETDVRPGLLKYRDWKLSQLKANLATEYVKMEKIQAIIDENWPRTLIKVKNDVIDKYLADMLEEIFGTEVPLDVTKKRPGPSHGEQGSGQGAAVQAARYRLDPGWNGGWQARQGREHQRGLLSARFGAGLGACPKPRRPFR